MGCSSGFCLALWHPQSSFQCCWLSFSWAVELCKLPCCSWGGSGLENAVSTYSTGSCSGHCCYPLTSPGILCLPLGLPAPLSWRCGEELPCFQSSFTGMGWLAMYLIYIRTGIFLEKHVSWKKVQTQRILHILWTDNLLQADYNSGNLPETYDFSSHT